MTGAGVGEGEAAAGGAVEPDNAENEDETNEEGEAAMGGVRIGDVCTDGGVKSIAGQGLGMLANSC